MSHVSAILPSPEPLIVVLGATGTGKSQLAVDIALKHNGEIINGDAMQLYEGLPIITNKITEEEQRGIPHHLLGVIGLKDETWTVGVFKKRAQFIIDDIRSRGKLPILVGGTHYYTQSLLFKEKLVDETATEGHEQEYLPKAELIRRYPILDAPTEKVLEQLTLVDPVMASRWHPNDRRKILRSLEIYLTTGRKASDLYREQRERKATTSGDVDSAQGGKDSLLNSALLFWVHADPDVLKPRLDARVDQMILHGLIDEVKSLRSYLLKQNLHDSAVDETRGIWISIGYKEFQPYFSALTDNSSQQDAVLHEAIEKVKIATRQYAKSQVRWIRIKLLAALIDQKELQRLYVLDGTDLHTWQENVSDPAVDIVSRFLCNRELPDPALQSDIASKLLVPKQNHDFGDRPDLWIKETCRVCHTTAVTQRQWEAHLKSRSHRRNIRKRENNGSHPPSLEQEATQASASTTVEPLR